MERDEQRTANGSRPRGRRRRLWMLRRRAWGPLLLTVLLGANALREGGRLLRVVGTVAPGALAAGVLVSSALAYHDVMAPYDRYPSCWTSTTAWPAGAQ